jgi:hypothetical protein
MSIATYEGMLVVDSSLSQSGLEALLGVDQSGTQPTVVESVPNPAVDQLAGEAALSGAVVIE